MLNRQNQMNQRRRVVGVSCAVWVCFLLTTGGCDNRQELARADTEKEANRILVELARSGITKVEKEAVKADRKMAYVLKVLPGDLQRAREVLVSADLPRGTHGGYQAMTEQGGLIPTKTEERAKLMFAMSEELTRTFETFDRVVAARVHITLPEKDPLRRDAAAKSTASATVLIKYAGMPDSPDAPAPKPTPADPYPDAPVKQADVQKIVARSMEGVSPDEVFVAYNRTTPLVLAAAANGETGSADSGDRKMMIQLLGVAVLFGVISIVLTTLLVKEKRRSRMVAV